LGFWDWSQVMRISVERLSTKMKTIKLFADLARLLRPMPRMPGAGELIKQIMLTPIAFKQPEYLSVLLRHINNLALRKSIDIIYCISEQRHPLLSAFRGFFRIDTAIHVYIKYFREKTIPGYKPLFIDGIDL
jgi:hypothetical protein